MTVRLSVKARQDLVEIGRYTAGQWGGDQARACVSALYSTFESLKGGPNPGFECSVELGRTRPIWRLPHASHIIYYKLPRSDLFVVRVLHKGMDLTRQL